MFNYSKEQLNAFNNDVETFLAHLNEKKEQIQADIKIVELPLSNGKICDFGCGLGHTTYALASLLQATESIGIDSDATIINRAQLWFKAIKLHKQLHVSREMTDEILAREACQTLEISLPPEFWVRDIVSGNDFPSDIGLAYCRKLLVNICYGKYGNQMSGIEGCNIAIKNIVRALTHGGWFIAIEEQQGGDFSQLFEKNGLTFIDKKHFQLGGALPYFRYVYRKL